MLSKLITPKEFDPREWQPPVISRAVSLNRLSILMGMGMGKTVSILTAVDIIANITEDVFPILVVAPKKVAINVWPYEHLNWKHLRHLRVSAITGGLDSRITALSVKADIYSINYENIPWLVKYLGTKWPFRCVICDESIKLKSFRTRQGGSRAAALGARAVYTKYWYNLTGEPCPNGLQDLWGPQWFIDQGKALGTSYSKYIEQYFETGYDGFKVHPVEGADKEIAELLKPTSITIRAEDYLSLDKPVVITLKVPLADRNLAAYKKLERELFVDLQSGRVTATNAADMTLKCLQYASGALYHELSGNTKWDVVHDEKMYALDSIIAEAGGEPIVVAYHFKSDLTRLQKRYPDAVVLRSKKDEDNWNAGKIPLLLAHPMSAGHGLNLQFGGRRLVFFSHWWALDPHNQIIERLGPMRQFQAGLNRLVYIYYIVAEDTIDEMVLLRHKSRKEVQEILKEMLSRL
jgi:SNF2-related domain